MALTANIHRDTKKRRKPFQPTDFLRHSEKLPAANGGTRMDAKQQKEIMFGILRDHAESLDKKKKRRRQR